ncbi:excinuclease ABC subunit UvrA [Chlamydiales bacterium]|nr:excinuclease ABC subunit UvrA [Chlamydiales bacterium]
MTQHPIQLKNVRVHNIRGVDLELTPNQLILFSGVSGSGKSSMAFDTIYMEGQRRYVESLSNYAKSQMGEMTKPELDEAHGITPTISIEQKSRGHNPRSTVGTLTEIYDYLRVLYARLGTPHCPVSGDVVKAQSKEKIISTIQRLPEGEKVLFLAPFSKEKKGEYREEFKELIRKGYMRVRIDGEVTHLEDDIELDGNVAHTVDIVIDRITTSNENKARILEAITQSLQVGEGVFTLHFLKTGEDRLFSMHAYSEKSNLSYTSLEPHDFSFNSPQGMCPTCLGLKEVETYDLDKVIDSNKSISEDCCSVASSFNTVRYGNIYTYLAHRYKFSCDTPWKKLTENAKKIYLYGVQDKWLKIPFVHPKTGNVWIDHVKWKGVLYEAMKRYSEAKSDSYRKKAQALLSKGICTDCQGSRLKPYPSACLLGGKTLQQVAEGTLLEAITFFNHLELTEEELLIGEELIREIKSRLAFLMQVGLGYLTLDRTSPTLSGGEAQRVRLASQIGCGLVGITYILDEPSIGLHPRDNHQLIETLKTLRDKGNTVIVVEHDEDTIMAADHIVDMGPGPGYLGGEIVVDGSLNDLLNSKRSVTGAFLRGDRKIAIPKRRKHQKGNHLKVIGATHHNLKNVNVKIPLEQFIAVTGVSGSGKSSLILETLFPALDNLLHRADLPVGKHKDIEGAEKIDKVIGIDQSPIGRNPRSNPSTYIKLFDQIRDLFASLPEARARGFASGQFSFNVKEGSCTTCKGIGMIEVDMDFLEAAWIDCPTCHGMRYDPSTLSITYKGKNIAEVLNMEVSHALEFFQMIPQIKKRLEVLEKVGLSYLKLGQPSPTLSGGEAQRIKLAKELLRPSTGKTLYILDEPTTGLHFADIDHLLKVLHHFVDEGNTVVVIEHNMDVIKTADWIIDVGPEGGNGGGEIVFEGTPEAVAKKNTPTGHAVKKALSPSPIKPQKNVKTATKKMDQIIVSGASENNLKRVDINLPRDQISVLTGPSGSGKSSLAFDTIYAEGQRRYAESLSPYARQFVKMMPKPKLASIEGLSPAIAIEQKIHAGNPRSTVGTMTEILDYLRLLYAHLGLAHNPKTGNRLASIEPEYIVKQILSKEEGIRLQLLAPFEMRRGEHFDHLLARLKKEGYFRIYLNDEIYHLDDPDEKTIPFDPKRKNHLYIIIDRLIVKKENEKRIREAVLQSLKLGKKSILLLYPHEEERYHLDFTDPKTGESFPPLTPKTFAFNTPEGFCPNCQGLGTEYGCNISRNSEILTYTSIDLLEFFLGKLLNHDLRKIYKLFLKQEKIPPLMELSELPTEQLEALFKGSSKNPWTPLPDGGSFQWIGVDPLLAKLAKHGRKEIKEVLEPLMDHHRCSLCQGKRINALASAVTLNKETLPDLCTYPVDRVISFVKDITLESPYLIDVKKTLLSRLHFLDEIGLNYISLDRTAPTLSGGEAQRIRLARQLGSGLTGALYVLDEPTIGLHPKDTKRLNNALVHLKSLGNTLVCVEHDPETLKIADFVCDFGPGSGKEGGTITASGTLKEIENNPNSLTGQYLSGKKKVPTPKKRRSPNDQWLSLRNANMHNVKNLDVDFPVGLFTCLTGVSGSGKSTLLHDIIAPLLQDSILKRDTYKTPFGELYGIDQFDKLLYITQDPIGLTSRSDVGTYSDILPKIRDFYGQLPEAAIRGLQPKNFSTNHLKGMCTNCWGMGYKKIEMLFLPPVKVICDQCHGMRLNPLSLEVKYQDYHFGDILKLTIDQAHKLFILHRKIIRSLEMLISVGLGYLQLGQAMATLSGGEAQRIRISKELSKRSTGHTIYLIDEPTTGLHASDIEKLILVLHKLVDKGNTLICIEHNIDLISNADYLVDLGPGAADQGGQLVVSGPFNKVIKKKGKSATIPFLIQKALDDQR